MRRDEFPIVESYAKDKVNEALNELKHEVETLDSKSISKKKMLELIKKHKRK